MVKWSLLSQKRFAFLEVLCTVQEPRLTLPKLAVGTKMLAATRWLAFQASPPSSVMAQTDLGSVPKNCRMLSFSLGSVGTRK